MEIGEAMSPAHFDCLHATKGLFSSRNENFYVTSDISVMSEGFSDTNKKTNYIARLETARRIY